MYSKGQHDDEHGVKRGGVENKADTVVVTLLNIQYLYNLLPLTVPIPSLGYMQWI